MTDLVGHFLLFSGVVVVFLMLPLIVGRLLRPKLPTAEKDAIYECGEPAIGSSYVQFDIRFYVVALLFIIFDVELAFFFPWAAVYGSAMQLADGRIAAGSETRLALSERLLGDSSAGMNAAAEISTEAAWKIGVLGLSDILVFFGVLLVGFAYVWKRGDLDWIRALSKSPAQAADQSVAG